MRIVPRTVGGCGHKGHIFEVVVYVRACLGRNGVTGVVCKKRICIPGFVVTVAGVDAFCLNEVRVYVHTAVIGSVGPVSTGGICLGDIALFIANILQAVVHHCGSERAVYRIDVAEVTGRIYVAEKGLGHCRKAVNAGVAYPHNRVDIRVLFKAFDIHLVGGVDEHDYVGRALLCLLYNRPFFVAYAEDIAAVGSDSVTEAFFAGIEAGTFAAHPAENYDCSIVVLVVLKVVALNAQFRESGFGGVGGAVKALILGCLSAEARAAPRKVCAIIFVSLNHCGVYVEHFFEVGLQSALVGVVVYYALIGNRAARGTAVVGRIAADTEQRYLGPFLC